MKTHEASKATSQHDAAAVAWNQYVAELDDYYNRLGIDSIDDLVDHAAAQNPFTSQILPELHVVALIRQLRELVIGLHHAAGEPLSCHEEETEAENLDRSRWQGRRDGLTLAASRLERVLEDPSSKVD
jgi:hypothetical protein